MGLLKKSDVLFERDEKGDLIPQLVVLEELPDKPEIKILPVTRGKLLRVLSESKNGETTKDQDAQLIVEHCVEPMFTEQDVEHLEYQTALAIASAILSASMGGAKSRKFAEGVIKNEEYLKKK